MTRLLISIISTTTTVKCEVGRPGCERRSREVVRRCGADAVSDSVESLFHALIISRLFQFGRDFGCRIEGLLWKLKWRRLVTGSHVWCTCHYDMFLYADTASF